MLEQLRRCALLRDGAELSDAQLLHLFIQGRDRRAMEALVRRHAPMVWGVCRRTLPHHEADDAFQATFLVLLRRAASIRSPELLPNWIYRVACQTARKARQNRAKLYAREKQVSVLPEPSVEPGDDTLTEELRKLLDEELDRLPEKYRIAVVLCDVEGRTRRDAAQQLHLPEGTVKSRLLRGRSLLARRLLKRGLGVSAASLAATGFQQAASGAVPAALLSHTVKAVSLLAAGEAAAAGPFSAGVSGLAEAVLRAMAAAKQKAMGLWVVLAAFVLAGGVAAYDTLAAHVPTPGTASVNTPADLGLPFELSAWVPGELRHFGAEGHRMRRVALAPDGKHLLTAGLEGTARYWDIATGKEIYRLPSIRGQVYDVAISPDGTKLLSCSGDRLIHVWDAASGKELKRLRGHTDEVEGVAVSPDGRMVASSGYHCKLRLWNLDTGQLTASLGGPEGQGLAFSPDGKLIAVWTKDRMVRLWDVENRKQVRCLKGHTEWVCAGAFSRDGSRLLTGTWPSDYSGPVPRRSELKLWEVSTGKPLLTIDVPAPRNVHGLSLSPDGRRALTCENAGLVELWDLETRKRVIAFKGHVGTVYDVAFLPGGRTAVSVGEDGTIRIWRLPNPPPAGRVGEVHQKGRRTR
jgi:RNA polymerase sigma factor (sigma-70 family)